MHVSVKGHTDCNTSSISQHLEVFAEVDIWQHLHYDIYAFALCGFLEKDTDTHTHTFVTTSKTINKNEAVKTIKFLVSVIHDFLSTCCSCGVCVGMCVYTIILSV